jgi:uncharacterized protein (TIGR03437 family)
MRHDLRQWYPACYSVHAARVIAIRISPRPKEFRLILKNTFGLRFAPALLIFAPLLSAAPRLSLSQTTIIVPVAQGSNGPTQTVGAFNLGNGKLNLTASSNVSWLVPTVGASQLCGLQGNCDPINIALQTSTLATGIYTGRVTLTDPNSFDAPQVINVTVQVGGDVPSNLAFFLADGGTTSTTFTTSLSAKVSVTAGSSWMKVATSSANGLNTVTVTATASATMAAGDSNGIITVSGSSFALDNKQIAVVLHVTTDPIAQLSLSSLALTVPQDAAKESIPIAVTNAGKGTLTVSGVTATADKGGTWLTAATVSGGISITADPTGLAPGDYTGNVVVASNATNGSLTIPVELTVEAKGPPLAFAGGVVNNGTFGNGEPVAQGDIAAVFGDQFTYDAPTGASALPLQTTLDNIQVLVNGKAAPLFFTSAGQINFEVPIDAATGTGTVQIVRNGTAGNTISVVINQRVPRFILLGGFGPYGVMTTPDGALTGIPSHPVKVGDTIVIYAVGLGPTTPVVPTGTASPGGNSLAKVPGTTQVCFGVESPFNHAPCGTPFFTGLTPGFVGLYQINVTVPTGVKSGAGSMSLLLVDNVESDIVPLVVQ